MPLPVKCPHCAATLEVPVLPEGEEGDTSASCGSCGLRFLFDFSGADPVAVDHAMRVASDLNIPGYRIIGVLKPGGMGYLYSAVREATKQLCAVKVMPPGYACHPALVERFRREARAMRAFRHPNVLQLLEVGESDPRFIAMPFVVGRTLRDSEEDCFPLKLADAAAVFSPLAEAVHHVHECGYLHRDIKPSNVFLTSKGEVLLFDFGITRECGTQSDLTDPGVNLGTPAYNAPELYERGETSPRSDQYSLAVLLYEMISGSLPMGVFRPPRDFCHDLPSSSSDAIMRALSHDPRDRFDTVQRFSREFFRPLVNRTPAEGYRDTVAELARIRPALFDAHSNHAVRPVGRAPSRSGIGALLARFSFTSKKSE
ncbi:protein kinase [bacterium]|nr:protein kinase [bacterium]